MDATAKTFRYLDEEEVAAQRKTPRTRTRREASDEACAILLVVLRVLARRRAARGDEHGDLRQLREGLREAAARQHPAAAGGQALRAVRLHRFDLIDPFKPRKIEPPKGGGGGGSRRT